MQFTKSIKHLSEIISNLLVKAENSKLDEGLWILESFNLNIITTYKP